MGTLTQTLTYLTKQDREAGHRPAGGKSKEEVLTRARDKGKLLGRQWQGSHVEGPKILWPQEPWDPVTPDH